MPITRSEGQQADQVAQSLLETYGVTVVKDWGEPGTGGTAGDWRHGYWSLDELHTLQEAIADLANAMGSAHQFVANVGSVTVEQVKTRFRGLASKGKVKFTASPTSFDKWTVVHELGHVWDAHVGWRLSKALETHTGGYTFLPATLLRRIQGRCDKDRRWPGCNRMGYFYGGPPPAGSDRNLNRKEDFAEAVAAYAYPDVAQSRVERFRDDDRYREFLYYADYTQTRRWAFVDGVIKGDITVR